MKLAGDVVVTGGCGAIGSNLVRRILKEPEVTRVIVIDDLSAGHRWLLDEAGPGFGLDGSVAQFKDPRVVLCQQSIIEDDLLAGIDEPDRPVVFHLAAHFANALSVEEPEDDTLINVFGTVAMLEWARAWRAPLFVFAAAGCAADHEDTPYQISKMAGEAYCRYYFDSVPTATFRFHNSYGPGEVPGPYRNVIPNWLWKAMNGEPLVIYGNGDDTRDFVYVEDVVEQLVSAEPSLKAQEVGTGERTRIDQLADMICDMATDAGYKRPEIHHADRRRWDHGGRAAVVDRRDRVMVPEGIQRTWTWLRESEAKIRRSMR